MEKLGGCLFCGSVTKLTDEHVFPASLGCEDVVKMASCSRCNGTFSQEFEAAFTNSMKFFCFLFQIGNREGAIPNMLATAEWRGAELKVLVRHDGSVQPLARGPIEVSGKDGRKEIEYIVPTQKERKRFQERMRQKGKELIPTDPRSPAIVIEPRSTIPMNFIADSSALRCASKVAIISLAKQGGLQFARSAAFEQTRHFVRTGDGLVPARLFVNKAFSDSVDTGPHQHSVVTYLNGKTHDAWAVVRFFGGVSYIVKLSQSYTGADYGYSYVYDAHNRRVSGLLAAHLELERLLIDRVLEGQTAYGDVEAAANHFLEIIQNAIKRKRSAGR